MFKKKSGFTLIELMIVLAVIAILVIVLVPKAGIFKSQAKNTGVVTNVNTVRAYLETKTGSNFITSSSTLQTSIDTAFGTNSTSGDKITNPFSQSTDVVVPGTNKANKPAVAIISGQAALSTDYAGAVVVEITSTAGSEKYTIYGVDNTGAKIGSDVVITK